MEEKGGGFAEHNNEEVMDTPERSKTSQIAASTTKFEESPVFNFINSLSPIKQVKSTHITQMINPLSFASLPSVFTSPHIRESRILRRDQFADPSKPGFSSDRESIVLKSTIFFDKPGKELENLDPRAPGGETSQIAKNFDNNCKNGLEYACSSSTLVPCVKEGSESGFCVNPEGLDEMDQNKEASSCDWECFIDASNLLMFESPNDSESCKKSIDCRISLYTRMEHDIQEANSQKVGDGTDPENLSTQPGEGIEMAKIDENHDMIHDLSLTNPNEKMDFEDLSGFYRGIRRRCLVYEMSRAGKTHLGESSGFDSSPILEPDGNTFSNDQQLVMTNRGNHSSSFVIPGIGLHLNALATTSASSGRYINGPSSSFNFHPQTTSQECVNNTPQSAASSETEIDNSENGLLPVEDACPVSAYIANEEMNQSISPKKKRRRSEQGVEGEACKRCNCKKSKCLKLYCECFAAGVYCVEPCACIDCFNKPVHEDTVLATRKQIESRNPLAFAPRVIRGPDTVTETGDDSSKTPASARHKRGCNCKKSGCLKKYCECYQGGVGCSINCRCEACKNIFGRKDGSGIIYTEMEFKEDQTDKTELNVVNKSLKKTAPQNDIEQKIDSATPATPLHAARQTIQRPFSSKNKLPRSLVPCIGSSSSSFSANECIGKQSLFLPTTKSDRKFEEDEEIPEILQGNSPICGVKSLSPNGKRVSPPHSVGIGMLSTGLRSSRKLILQSIPSFPSLNSNQ